MVRKLCLLLALVAAAPAFSAPLKIGYSDYPGWVAWQVAIDKGWLKEAGVDAEFQWFDYSPSMDAFGAGKIDAIKVVAAWATESNTELAGDDD